MEKTKRAKKSEVDKAFDGLSILFVSLMLKLFSDEEDRKSPPEIREKLLEMIPCRSQGDPFEEGYEEDAVGDNEHFGEKYAKSTLEYWDTFAYSDDQGEKNVAALLTVALGGRIRSETVVGGKQKKYYFDPLLSISDIRMLVAAVESNRYLEKKQKEYLIDRLSILHPAYRKTEGDWKGDSPNRLSTLVTFFRQKTDKELRGQNRILENVRQLHKAIAGKYKVDIVYGEYKKAPDSDKVVFETRYSKEKLTRTISPYAMLWNDGEYYLLAKYENYEDPTHLRVDRIIKVVPHYKKDSNSSKMGKKAPEKRDKYPQAIEEYFTITREGEPDEFRAIDYANAHPHMAVYHKGDKLQSVEFECNNNSIHLLTDNFGTNLTLEERPNPVATEKTILDGRPATYYTATVRNVQFENVRDFAIAYAGDITVLRPNELVKAVQAKLRKIVEKYDKVEMLNNQKRGSVSQ